MQHTAPRRHNYSAVVGTEEEGPVWSSLKEASPAARKRQAAATRSAQLTHLFDRLSSVDANALQKIHSDEVSVDDGYLDKGGAQVHCSPPSLHSTLGLPHHPAKSLDNPSSGGVVPRSGLSTFSPRHSRLPSVFREQAGILRSLETASGDVRHTLKQLHHDLAFYAERRSADKNTDGCDLPFSSPLLVPPAHSAPDTVSASKKPAERQLRVSDVEALSETVRMQRARAAAADEGAPDDQSVEDYGVDCVVPPLTSDSRLQDLLASITVSVAKMKESANAIYDIEAAAPSTSVAPWWSSALRVRGMKASAARLDYHAHAALNWSHRAREQLLLQAVVLNKTSVDTRTQILEQQRHWDEFQTRLRDSQQTTAQMQADIAQCQLHVQAELARRATLQKELRLCAQEKGLIHPDEFNPLKAELALLLEEREWPSEELRRDVNVVLDWLRSVSTVLE
ncbi:hypothetical protein JKF63_07607 [Porcisia hertigi]|uniref:Uncharacterized protein n=1 Tax=Porcisia hertigi TaxID=2761500 RepID=A0A836LM39_9TRYP|nr:hypothetical protein JKF63_07607 [Porcisia hertigi]